MGPSLLDSKASKCPKVISIEPNLDGNVALGLVPKWQDK